METELELVLFEIDDSLLPREGNINIDYRGEYDKRWTWVDLECIFHCFNIYTSNEAISTLG